MKLLLLARLRLAAFVACLLSPFLAPLALIVVLIAGPAFAADAVGNGVTFDLSAWLSPLVQVLGAVLLAVASWAVSFLPPIVKAALTEQLLKRAVDYAVATVAGAAAGKTVTIPVANELIRVAAQYAADNGPKVTKWAADSLGPKIIARLNDKVVLPAEASDANLDHNPQPQT